METHHKSSQGELNKVAGGKRMLSSMAPVILTRPGKQGGEELFLVLGASGGPTITTAVLQILLNAAVFEMNVREAVEAPRFHHQHLPDVVYAEPGTFSADTRVLLERMGYTIEIKDHLGMAAAVMRYADGWFTGWADGVGGGAGTGW